jgi:hypothetical protein
MTCIDTFSYHALLSADGRGGMSLITWWAKLALSRTDSSGSDTRGGASAVHKGPAIRDRGSLNSQPVTQIHGLKPNVPFATSVHHILSWKHYLKGSTEVCFPMAIRDWILCRRDLYSTCRGTSPPYARLCLCAYICACDNKKIMYSIFWDVNKKCELDLRIQT